ncbi:MAG: chemosensory pili system protein ChpA (sensor histidine kinase/response regulator), partial [Gammaproteobacteria bacterium]
MNSQQTSINQNALGWVKKSIDDNLSETTRDLKLYIENRDENLLEDIKHRLEVIQGVLKMIEQYGAAMLTEEMISLCDFIADHDRSANTPDEQALEVLLRAVLQLPDYLEHIQSGNRDIPIAILPLLNDIRSVKKQDLFSEKLLFLPDLSMHHDDAEIDSIDDQANQNSKLLVKKLRPTFQLSLLRIIKETDVDNSLKRLGRVFEVLEERSNSEQVARIWWIVGALIESVSLHQLELGVSIKNLLGKVDALFRVLLIIGERGLLERQPIDLIKNFLYYIAQPECDGPKSQAIKTAYRLEEFLPSEAVRSQLLSNIAGPNQALLKTVAEAVSNDIETVKSTLEVYVNGDLTKVDKLQDIPQELHVISDTLAMIGLGEQRQLIEAQIVTVKNIVDGETQPSEEKLLAMASELIQVEQALEQMQKRQPRAEIEDSRSEGDDVSRDFELDSVLVAIVSASLDDVQKTKSAILEFIKDPTRSENMELCVALMEQSRGALLMLEQKRAVAVMDGLLRYMKDYDIEKFMEVNRLDSLSQVIASLEYYLEALGERRSDADSILDFADTQLAKLFAAESISNKVEAGEYPVIPDEATETVEAIVDENIEALDPAETESDEIEPIEANQDTPAAFEIDFDLEFDEAVAIDVAASDEVAFEADVDINVTTAEVDDSQIHSDVMVVDELNSDLKNLRSVLEVEDESTPSSVGSNEIVIEPVNETLVVLKPGGDPEILEIYLEEAEEEATNITRLQKDWLLHPEDQNAVRNIRRAFHTIKGSGRLVGATKIAEFAWDYEQLLNRVIDKAIMPEDDVIEAVGQAAIALQELVTELTTETEPASDIPYLRGLARALAEFKPAKVLAEQTLQANTVESIYDQITDTQVEDETNVVAHSNDNEPQSDTIVDAVAGTESEPVELDVEANELSSDKLSSDKPGETQDALTEDGTKDEGLSDPFPVLDIDDDAFSDPILERDKESKAASITEGPHNDPFVQAPPGDLAGEEAETSKPVSQEPEEPTGLSFAPELLTIYQQEVEHHLGTVNSALNKAEKNQELIPGEDIYRALHTIHGASKTADIVSIGELAGLMEKPLKLAIAQKMALDHEIIALYRDGHRELQAMTTELVATLKLPVIPNDLKISFQALAEDIEEHT